MKDLSVGLVLFKYRKLWVNHSEVSFPLPKR